MLLFPRSTPKTRFFYYSLYTRAVERWYQGHTRGATRAHLGRCARPLARELAAQAASISALESEAATLNTRFDEQNVNECAQFKATNGKCKQMLSGNATEWQIIADTS